MRGVAILLVAIALLVPPLVLSPRAAGDGGGELRVALQAAPSLDPLQFPQNRMVQELAFDSLTRLGTDALPRPWLASSWTANAGARTITVTLRAATWPDGSAVTGQDVAWSYGKHLGGGTASGFTATAVDAGTVRFTFTSGGGDFLGNAATLPIAWKSGSNSVTYGGPFVVSAQTASDITMDANARHWNGRPNLDRIVFRFPFTLAKNPDDSTRANDAACALIFGDVSLLGWPVSSIEMNTDRDCVAGYGGFRDGFNRTLSDVARRVPLLTSADDPALQFLTLGMNTEHPPLDDGAFRQAISRAVDRTLIATSIESGTDIADSPISPANLAWLNASVPKYRVPYVVSGTTTVPSLEAVNRYLDEIGYLDADGDGWRDTPAGAPFHFTLLAPDIASDPKVSKYVDLETKLRSIGINVTEVLEPYATLRAAVGAGTFDLYADLQPARADPAFLFDLFHRDGADNRVRLDDATLNAILERARDTFDPAVRLQAVLDAQGWIAENAPMAPVIHMRAVYSYNRSFAGWVDALGGIANFWSFTSVRYVAPYGPLSVSVDVVRPSLPAGETTDVLVRVLDAQENPVPGAAVALDGQGLSATTGTTDAQGTLQVEFTAPAAAVPQDFPITATATKTGYDAGLGNATVSVHPPAKTFDLTIAKQSATLGSAGSVWVRVTVYDLYLAVPAVGANVTVAVSPAGLSASVAQASGVTDASGTFNTTFTADVTVASRFVVTFTASAPGYQPAEATTSLEVGARSNPPVTPALDTVSMVAVVAALAAIYGFWQRRKWTARRP